MIGALNMQEVQESVHILEQTFKKERKNPKLWSVRISIYVRKLSSLLRIKLYQPTKEPPGTDPSLLSCSANQIFWTVYNVQVWWMTCFYGFCGWKLSRFRDLFGLLRMFIPSKMYFSAMVTRSCQKSAKICTKIKKSAKILLIRESLYPQILIFTISVP